MTGDGGLPSRADIGRLLVEAADTVRLGITLSAYEASTDAYRILYANRAICDIAGATLEEVLSLEDTWAWVDPTDRARLTELAAANRMSGRITPEIEYSILRPDGSRVRVGTFTAPVPTSDGMVMVTFTHDLSQLETARRAERVSDVQFKAVTEASPNGIALVRNQRFVYVNAAFARLLGIDEASEALPIPDALAVRGIEPRPVQLASGLTVELRSVSIDLPGEADSELLFLRDLTEQLALQEKLIHTDRLAAVGTLAAGIAHEINNPLAYVIANLELCLDQLQDSPSPGLEGLEPRLHAAMQGAQRVRRIVRDLRTYSREPTAEEKQPVAVEGAIATALSMGGSAISRKAVVERDVDAGLRVLGMPGQLEQVFLNILLNAAQAFEQSTSENRIRIRAKERNGVVVVEVEDNGPGIDEATRARIFDPFFTTKPVGQGTGLGLSICRNLVESMGGRIELTSSAPGRTVFEVALDMVRETATENERPHILVIDDEVEVLSLLEEAFANVGIRTARRGGEALQILRTEGPFDLVLCDVLLMDMQGPEVRRQALEIDPSLGRHFVYMTGAFGSLSARERAECPLLEKPFELKVLRELVRTMARRR